jgi:hypothetical protein
MLHFFPLQTMSLVACFLVSLNVCFLSLVIQVFTYADCDNRSSYELYEFRELDRGQEEQIAD